MCVTSEPATIDGTQAYVYATTNDDGQPVHVSGYLNTAENFGYDPNCMFLNYAGSDLRPVNGPQHTRHLMGDMTEELQELVYVERFRSSFGYEVRDFEVVDYGDYTVVLSQGPGDILSVLDQVRSDRRPAITRRLQEMVDFYMSYYSRDSFVLACFDGKTKPNHPIVVSYQPRNPSVLTIPGLDAHDGKLPVIGAPVHRNFKLAFAVNGAQLPHQMYYQDSIPEGTYWAPESVVGFVDNRPQGPNGDYAVHLDDVRSGLNGRQLADRLITI